MPARESDGIESFSLSITHGGRNDGSYDLQWEIVSFTQVPDDVVVSGSAIGGRKVSYGEVLGILNRALQSMRP